MNIWRELKHDFTTDDKEYRKQRRELNQKLEQIKSSLLSKCDQDVQDFLENTHARDVLYSADTPVAVAMDYIEIDVTSALLT